MSTKQLLDAKCCDGSQTTRQNPSSCNVVKRASEAEYNGAMCLMECLRQGGGGGA